MTRQKTTKIAKKIAKDVSINTPQGLPKTVSVRGVNLAVLIKVLLVIAIGVVVFLLVQKNRHLLIVGTVNKSPVYRWELNSKMAEKYGEQTFEEIISERLLNENLKKNKISISQEEVNSEMAKIKEQYGGDEQFKLALEQFGMTEDQAIKSIEQSLGLKKLIESQNTIEIKDEDVKQYFTDNKDTYTDKKLEDVSAEIKEILYQQEIYTKSQEWYSTIRQEAKVSSYL